MSKLLGYRDAVIATIKTRMTDDFRDVDKHGGTFTEEMLKRYAVKAPACRVAFLDTSKIVKLPSGEMGGPAKLAGYVITDDIKGLESFDAAVMLAEKLAGVIEGNTFGAEHGGMAQVQSIQNLFTLASEKRGFTIAAVTFQADVRFGVNTYDRDAQTFHPRETPLTITELEMLGLGGENLGFTGGD